MSFGSLWSWGYPYTDLCNRGSAYYAAFCSAYYYFGSGLCDFGVFSLWGRYPRIARGPTTPPPYVPGDTSRGPNTKLIPGIPHPDTTGTKIGGPRNAAETEPRPMRREIVDGGRDGLEKIYTIPRRALDGRRDNPDGRASTAGPSGIRGGVETRPTAGGPGEGRGGSDASLGGRRMTRERNGDALPTGRHERPRFDPPPRESPRDFNPPQRTHAGGSPGSSGRGGADPAPRSFDPPPRPMTRGEPRAEGGARSSGGAPRQAAPPRHDPPPRQAAPPKHDPPPRPAPPPPPRESEKKPVKP
jgi:hypothetical protein